MKSRNKVVQNALKTRNSAAVNATWKDISKGMADEPPKFNVGDTVKSKRNDKWIYKVTKVGFSPLRKPSNWYYEAERINQPKELGNIGKLGQFDEGELVRNSEDGEDVAVNRITLASGMRLAKMLGIGFMDCDVDDAGNGKYKARVKADSIKFGKISEDKVADAFAKILESDADDKGAIKVVKVGKVGGGKWYGFIGTVSATQNSDSSAAENAVNPGDKVKVMDGPFNGADGVVEKVDGGNVTVNMGGLKTKVAMGNVKALNAEEPVAENAKFKVGDRVNVKGYGVGEVVKVGPAPKAGTAWSDVPGVDATYTVKFGSGKTVGDLCEPDFVKNSAANSSDGVMCNAGSDKRSAADAYGRMLQAMWENCKADHDGRHAAFMRFQNACDKALMDYWRTTGQDR